MLFRSISSREILDPSIVPPYSARDGLIFVGNGENPTNDASITWFLQDVLPVIRRKAKQTIPLTIVGADWSKASIAVFNATRGVNYTGMLPADQLNDELLQARVFVSPISASTGLNTKNVLAISRALPMVTTPTGAAGLCEGMLVPGTGCHQALNGTYTQREFLTSLGYNIAGTTVPSSPFTCDWTKKPPQSLPPFLVASTAEQFADYTLMLLNNEQVWTGVSKAASKFAHDFFSIEAQAQDLDNFLSQLSLQ